MKPITYAEAMEIQTQEAADIYLARLVRWCMRVTGCERQEAERIQRSNLGYFAGYYSSETRRRVERLFRCEHPIFGAIEKNGPPTPAEALQAGFKMGVAAMRRKP